MEVMAVLAALKRLKYASEVVVYSDSKYVVNAVGDWVDGQPVAKRIGWMVKWRQNCWTRPSKKGPPQELKNADLWRKMYHSAVRHRSVAMRWVRGHAGNELNELCDAVALEERIKATNGLLEARSQA
jgi:ribonuclease HI